MLHRNTCFIEPTAVARMEEDERIYMGRQSLRFKGGGHPAQLGFALTGGPAEGGWHPSQGSPLRKTLKYNPPMRLTLVSTRSGSAADRFSALCNGLCARGHAVTAVCHPGCRAQLAPGVAHLPWRSAGPRWNPLTRLTLALALLDAKPDLIHAHDDKAAALVARAAKGIWRCPKVATLTGPLLAVGRLVPAFDRVLVYSQAAAARIGEKHPKWPVEVVFPGVAPAALAADAGQSQREIRMVPYGVPVALVAADMTAESGLGELLTLWPGAGEAELWVSGGGPQAKELEAQARMDGLLIEGGYERGMVNGVRWLGRSVAWPALLAACDLVVIPPRAPEQTRVLAQALMAGKPVVAAGHAWAQAVLPPEYAVPAEDLSAWREALATALADVAFARRAQEGAFARAREEWTQEAMAAAAEAAYGRTLAL